MKDKGLRRQIFSFFKVFRTVSVPHMFGSTNPQHHMGFSSRLFAEHVPVRSFLWGKALNISFQYVFTGIKNTVMFDGKCLQCRQLFPMLLAIRMLHLKIINC